MKKHQPHGLVPVVAAILGNSIIMVIKFAGFFISGSSALFSEAIHSVADTLNQIFLLVGIKKSLRQADKEYAYGYGQERFFWALISACCIFFLGAGITTYNGINSLIHPEKLEINFLAYLVLAVSFIVESFTFYVAWRELKSAGPGKKLKILLKEGDPSTIAVLFEDGVALLGVTAAFIGILLTNTTGKYYWDAASSILIGLMLGVMALILINKNRGFLIKKSIPDEVKEKIIEILQADPVIERVLDFKSAVIDINQFRVKCEVELNGPALLQEILGGSTLHEEFDQVNDDFEEFKKFFVDYADRVPRVVGRKIDQLEKKIKSEVPGSVHIDIEVN